MSFIIRILRKISIRTVIIFLLVLCALGFYLAYYYHSQYVLIKTNPNFEAQKKADEIITKVGRLIELPKDDAPEISVIEDKNQLSNQPFFVSAENGDVVMIYTKSLVAILYRPSINKIISVGPVSINNQTPEVATSKTQSSTTATSTGTLKKK